ncbi:MAG: hypothetical protein K9N07_04555 [Candidatus Cloacimonetes bacterium]|nr:hypothetical protein [Candidatus Cloacimonadota bacterium]
MKIKLFIIMNLLQTVLFSYNFFSPMIKWEYLAIIEPETSIQLKAKNIIENSEKVVQDSIIISPEKYDIDYKTGTINFEETLGNCIIEYYIYPPQLIDRYFLFQTQEYSDSTDFKVRKISSRRYSYNSNLDITGSKTISVSVANNEDLDLDQSLFLKINGKLSDEMSIEAQLSDSQTPITPEGDSRELSNLDKIFIRLYGERYEIAFGDLEMDFPDLEYMKYSTQFEGLKLSWDGYNKVTGALAVAKGKRAVWTFTGIQAKQGPYYLAVDGISGVLVIPGSEEVFLNGEQMQRGVDYTIDYSEGGITFSNQHFIASTSNIRVVFQHSDENYNQNMYLASSEIKIIDDFKLTSGLIIQNDDKNNPLQDVYTDDDLIALKSAGDQPVWVTGIMESEDGNYEISEDGIFYYYVGNDSTTAGHYNIYFVNVGSGNGDYILSSDGSYYEYSGAGNGNYLPIKELKSPQQQLNWGLNLNYLGEFYQLSAEGLFTSHDKNTFSDLDDKDNNDLAAKYSVRMFSDYDKINPEIKLIYERLGGRLSPFAQLQSAVDSYEFTQLPDSLNSSEFSAEVNMDILECYAPKFIYRKKNISDYADQHYISISSHLKQQKFSPKIFHRYLRIKQMFVQNQEPDSKIYQHELKSQYKFGKFALGFNLLKRNRVEDNVGIIISTEDNDDLRFQFETINWKWFSSRLFYEKRKDLFSAASDEENNILQDETTYTYGVKTFVNSAKNRINVSLTHRKVVDDLENKVEEYDLADISTVNNLLDNLINVNTNYSLRNIEFYPKIKEFQFVGENLGSYSADTLFVGYFQGDYEWRVIEIDYDNPEMSVEVNTNLSLHISPEMITDSFLKKFQSETFLLLTENSRSKDKRSIYFLDQNAMMDEETTIYGRRSIKQTLWYQILERKITSKLGYKIEETLDSRYNEEISNKEQKLWETELRISAIKNTNLELHYDHSIEKDSRYNSRLLLDTYGVDILNRMSSDLTLRSSAAFSFEQGKSDTIQSEYTISAFELGESATYFFKNKYRFFVKLSYKKNQRTGSNFLNFLSEKKGGHIFKWDFNLSYNLSNFTLMNLQYSGNAYPGEKQNHRVSLELKAEL